MNLIKCYQTHSTWYKGARAGSKPVGVLWHDTAAGNPSLLEGKEDLIALGEKVKEAFGEKAEPLYPRLSQYISILESYGFLTLS